MTHRQACVPSINISVLNR